MGPTTWRERFRDLFRRECRGIADAKTTVHGIEIKLCRLHRWHRGECR